MKAAAHQPKLLGKILRFAAIGVLLGQNEIGPPALVAVIRRSRAGWFERIDAGAQKIAQRHAPASFAIGMTGSGAQTRHNGRLRQGMRAQPAGVVPQLEQRADR